MSDKPTRPRCQHCYRPLITCFCDLVTPINNEVELIILRHPLETGNAKNTATLLHLSLNNSRLLEGESFDAASLNTLIEDPHYLSVLLYPPTPEADALSIQEPPPLPNVEKWPAQHMRLFVLDGTWKKSRKMLYLNSPLQRLPRLSLNDCPPSRYHIRKADSDHQLSTLEAACYALQQLEHQRVDYSTLLDAFDRFVERQLDFSSAARDTRSPPRC